MWNLWEKHDTSWSYFVVPCKSYHTLCPLYFLSLKASKGAMHYFQCPCCKGGDNSMSRRVETKLKLILLYLPIQQLTLCFVIMQPISWMRMEEEALHQIKLSPWVWQEKWTLCAISFTNSTENIDETISNKNKKKLDTFFQLLQLVLVLFLKMIQKQHDQVSSVSKSGNVLVDVETSDNSCLFQCIYSLSISRVPPSISDVIRSKSTQKSNVHLERMKTKDVSQ